MKSWNINSCTLSTEVQHALVWSTAAHVCLCVNVCVWLSAGVWYCVSEATCSVSERQGKICRCVHLCVSVFEPMWVCLRVFGAPHSQITAQAGSLFRQRGRGVKQIKHKPTNHRRWLISAVLKGEPGMSDDSPLWISQWRCTVCHHECTPGAERGGRAGRGG